MSVRSHDQVMRQVQLKGGRKRRAGSFKTGRNGEDGSVPLRHSGHRSRLVGLVVQGLLRSGTVTGKERGCEW